MKFGKNKIFLALLMICGIAIAISYITPHIIGWSKLEKQGLEYYPLSLEAGAATDFYDEILGYVPNARESWERHWLTRNADSYEYLDGPMVRHALSSLVLAPFFGLNGDVTRFVILTDFLFPLISFFLIFYLFFLISGKKILSLCFSTIISLSPKISLLIFPLHLSSLKDFIKHFIPLRYDMWIFDNSDLVKMEAMKPGIVFVFCFLIFIYLTIRNGKLIHQILSGIFLGLLFYTYSFHWVFFVVAMFILSVALIVNKEYKIFKKVLTAGIVGIFVSLPFWFNFLWINLLPHYNELSETIGKETANSFRWSLWPEYILYFILATIIWFFYRKNNRPLALLLSSLLLTNIAVYNLQIFAGFQFQPNHWSAKIVWLVLAIAWLAIFSKISDYVKSQNKRRIIKLAFCATVALFLFNAFAGKIIWASGRYNNWTIPEDKIKSFVWLLKNTPKDSVVMTPSLITNRYIPLYTNNKIFVPFYENAPSSEVLDRLYIAYKIFDVKKNYFNEVFFLGKNNLVNAESAWNGINFHEKRGIMYIYGFKYTNRSFDSNFKKSASTFTEEQENEIVKNYDNYPKFGLNFLLKKYRIDYVYYGPNEKIISPMFDFSKSSFLERVYDSGGIEIYKINYDKIKIYERPKAKRK